MSGTSDNHADAGSRNPVVVVRTMNRDSQESICRQWPQTKILPHDLLVIEASSAGDAINICNAVMMRHGLAWRSYGDAMNDLLVEFNSRRSMGVPS